MSWVAVGAAAVGAVGSYMSAKQANKPQKGRTDQTTTQTPYLDGVYEGDIYKVLDMQRQLASTGAPQLNPDGTLSYRSFGDTVSSSPAAASTAVSSSSGPIPAGAHVNRDGRLVNASGKAWNPARDAKAGAPSGSPAGKPAAGSLGSSGGTGPAKPMTATDIFTQVAQRGLDVGNTATIGQGRNSIANILGASGQQGSAAAGERTGFEGYNPILDRLAGTLEGDVNDRNAKDLLLQYLNETGRGIGGGAGAGGGSGSGSGGGGYRIANGLSQSSYNPNATPGQSPNQVPDTMAVQSYFGDQTRRLMDDGANDAELSALIDAMNKDTERGMFRDLAQLDASAQSSGRFGGDMWKGLSADARLAALDEANKNAAGVRVGDRQARLQARLNALGMVNQRDLGLLDANVQREGIAANERSSSNAVAASAGSAADQLALAKRGQDLSAISQLGNWEQGELGQLGDVGQRLSVDRLAASGLIPGLEGIGLSGLGIANQAGGGLVDMRGQDVQRQIANAQNSLARLGMNQQASMWNAGQYQQQVNNYLSTILGIGGMGGTSHTAGTNVQPGLGVSPMGSAVQGGLGAGLAAYGMKNQK